MPAISDSRDAKRKAAAIVDGCRLELEPSGFVHREGNTIWRRTNLKFDILKFHVISPARCRSWRLPLGSLGLDPSCLLPFLPRLRHLTSDGMQPNKGFGQLRLAIRRGIFQRTVKANNIWWAGDTDDVFDLVLTDFIRVIQEKAFPFFSRFEDPAELLRTFLEDENAIGREGVWEFGNKGSPSRLLYTGFAAIECEKWDLAIASLRACQEKTMSVSPILRERVAANLMPYVDQGLACAAQKRPWASGLE